MEEAGLTPNAPVQGSGWATWSLVLGIIAMPSFILFIPGLLALIFGIVALVKIGNSAGRLKGKGKAIAGIILGGLSFILVPLISIVAAIVIPNLIAAKEKADKIQSVLETKEVVSIDGISRVDIPGDWEVRTDLNDDASIQVANARKEQYLVVLTDSKIDFDDISVEEHSQMTRQHILEKADNGQIVGEPKHFEINGQAAVQYEIHGSVDKLKVVYLHVTVEGKEHFHQILAWTLASMLSKNKPVLESVINTFKE